MVDTSFQTGLLVIVCFIIATLILTVIGVILLIITCKQKCQRKDQKSVAVYDAVSDNRRGFHGNFSAFLDANGYEVPVTPPSDYSIPRTLLTRQDSSKHLEGLWGSDMRAATVEMNPNAQEVTFGKSKDVVSCANNSVDNYTLSKPSVKLTLTVSA